MSEPTMNTSSREITDPDALALLIDTQKSRFLMPFLRGENTLAEASAHAKVSKSLMSYWIGKFIALGLIEVIEPAPLPSPLPLPTPSKRGRLYRATHTTLWATMPDYGFHCDMETLSAHSDSYWTHFKTAVIHRARARQLRYRLVLTSSRGGLVRCMIEPIGKTLAEVGILNNWAKLNLTTHEAQALRDELSAVYARYGALSSADKPQLCHVHVAAVEDAVP